MLPCSFLLGMEKGYQGCVEKSWELYGVFVEKFLEKGASSV